jgi:signal recognition particle subunit SRP54
MFDVLSKGFKSARLALTGKAELTEDNLAPALREVRTSLIQADVELGVIKRFLARVKDRSLGEIVPLKGPTGQTVQVTPQDWFIKACYDELVELMGPVDASLNLDGKPAVIMMVGLQGSGKTTTTGKLAKRLMAQGKKPLLVAADIYRPAAVDQLRTVGRKVGVPVFSIRGMKPVQLSQMAVTQARNVGRDVVIIDTAGRLAVDDDLMQEVVDIKSTVKPDNILFVVDAMIGQDAVRTAAEFDRRLDFTGFVLTKLDGDARGGAALSIKEVTGKPVKFLGQGEALDRLEEFRPDGLAQRILGFGDIVGLMQDFEKHVDQKEAEKSTEKMLKGQFTYADFVKQLTMVRRMGPLKDLMAKMPGISGMMDMIPPEALDDGELDRTMAIIGSMTNQERDNPDLLSSQSGRLRRVAIGSGRSFEDVRALHKRFLQAREMMKGFGDLLGNPSALAQAQRMMQGGGGMGGLGGMPGMGGMPGGMSPDGGGAKSRVAMNREDKLALRKKRKQQKKARKKNRK